MKIRKSFAPTTLCLFLVGCQLPAPGQDSVNWALPPGTTLSLVSDIEVPSGWGRAMFQDGLATHPNDIDLKRPSCGLFLNERARRGVTLTVSADSFALGTVHRPFPDMLLEHRRGFVTEIPLDSPRQPLVRDLICQITGNPRWVGHLSLAEIREALGETFELQLPDEE